MTISEDILRIACPSCRAFQNDRCPFHYDEKEMCAIVGDVVRKMERRILYFDTETTGLPFKPGDPQRYGRTHNTGGYPKLVQLAWILTDGDDRVLSEHCHIIRPEGFSIPEETSSIHGITTEVALKEGESLGDVLLLISEDILQANVLVGHNIDYDIQVLVGELRRKNRKETLQKLTEIPVIDTMKTTVKFCAIPFPEGQPRKYDTGCDYKYPKLRELHFKLFGTEFENAHDALADIRATRRCFVELEKLNIRMLINM